MKPFLLSFLFLIFSAGIVHSEIVSRNHMYKDGDVELEGYVAYDSALTGKRPVVLIVHQWKGLGAYEKLRADMLAKLGYLAFCVDIYGKGERAQNYEQARSYATKYRSDIALMRRRVLAGMDAALSLPVADDRRVAAIGYCFGGGVVLELARSGADVAGVVSFHGNLDTPNPEDARQIKGCILVCHGGAEKVVPMEHVVAFHKEMESAQVDYQLVIYAGAVHAFTHMDQPERYNKAADRRSWQHMNMFLQEIFK